MAVQFSEREVLEATGARRLLGGPGEFDDVCTDSRRLAQGCLFVALAGPNFDGHAFIGEAARAGAAGAVVERGRRLSGVPAGFALYEVDATLAALGALGAFHRRRFQIPVGALTGSNGKTTTKEMVAAILRTRGKALATLGNLNNEVGVPLTLFQLGGEHVAAVLEMGMSHPGEIERLTRLISPTAGLVTAIQPAHLAGLGSIEGVARAKGELFRALPAGALAVVNLDDARVAAAAEESGARMLSYGRSASADVRLVAVEAHGRDGMTISLEYLGREHRVRLAVIGWHNAQNAAGAFAMGAALGYPPEACALGLGQARPVARRLSWVNAAEGYAVLDDCYNANPASMAAALDSLRSLAASGRAVAVLGDMLELGEHEHEAHAALGKQAAAMADLLAFFGSASRTAYASASGLGGRAAHFLDAEALVTWLRPQLRAGDVVLVKGSRGMKLERVVEALSAAPLQGAH